MADLIDRQAAMKIAARYGLHNGTTLGLHSGVAELIEDRIERLPKIEAEPVRHGKWLLKIERKGFNQFVCQRTATARCSECGYDLGRVWFYLHPYLPIPNENNEESKAIVEALERRYIEKAKQEVTQEKKVTNYCPNCGAKMKIEVENDE